MEEKKWQALQEFISDAMLAEIRQQENEDSDMVIKLLYVTKNQQNEDWIHS